MPAVDLDVPGEQKARARAGPAPIERFQPGRGMVAGVGEAFAHRRLGETVGKRGAARKVEGPGERICHGFSIWLATSHADLRGARPPAVSTIHTTVLAVLDATVAIVASSIKGGGRVDGEDLVGR